MRSDVRDPCLPISFAGRTSSEAAGINDVGQIVGHSTLSGPQPQVHPAFLFSEQRWLI